MMPDPKRNIEEISEAVIFLTDKFEKLGIPVSEFIKLIGSVKGQLEEAGKAGDNLRAGALKGVKEIKKQQTLSAEDFKSSWKDSFKSIGEGYEDFVKDLRSKGGPHGAIGELLPQKLEDTSGIQGGMAKLKGSILSELPFGGLLGLMMYGSMKEEEFRAHSTGVMRMFQQSGEVATGTFQAIEGEARKLGVKFGMKPPGMFAEFEQSARQFAQAGVDVEDVLQKINMHGGETGESLLKTSSRLDSLFEQAAGTAARNMSQLIRDFNLDGAKSAEVVAGIGLAARESGSSVTAFTSSVMRNAAAMRMMRVDIEEVANAQLKFTKIAEKLMPGTSEQFRAQYAEQATQQITGGIAGMGVGMSAELGSRMGLGSDLEAYYKFREGVSGEGGGNRDIFAGSIAELLKMAKETGGTEQEQRRFLEVGPAKMGFEGSRVLMELQKQAKNSGKTVEEVVKSKEGQKALQKAFEGRAAKTSRFQISLLEMQDGIMKIGAGLLGTVMAGFKMIAGLIMKYGSGGDMEAQGEKMMQEAGVQGVASMEYVREGLEGVGKGLGKGYHTVLGTGKSFGATGGGGRETEEELTRVSSVEAAKAEATRRTASRLEESLKRKGIGKKNIRKLLDAYYTGEAKEDARGEEAFESKAKSLLGKKKGKELGEMAGHIEDWTGTTKVRVPGHEEPIRLDVIIKAPYDYYSVEKGY